MTDNDKLEREINIALKQSADAIDAETLSRIRQARTRAIQQTEVKQVNWFGIMSGAVATACVMVFIVLLLTGNDPLMQAMPVEDIELVTVLDELELYENLEFFQWLDEYES